MFTKKSILLNIALFLLIINGFGQRLNNAKNTLPCQTAIDTLKLLNNDAKYLREAKFCLDAAVDILQKEADKYKGQNDSVYIKRILQIANLEYEKRPWKAIKALKAIVFYDQPIKNWAAKRKQEGNTQHFWCVQNIIHANRFLVGLLVQNGAIEEALPFMKKYNELVIDKNALWCDVGEYTHWVYDAYIKLIEKTTEESALPIAKYLLFDEYFVKKYPKIIRRIEILTLIDLEQRFGKENLWKEMEKGIENLDLEKRRVSTINNSHTFNYRIWLPLFEERISVEYTTLQESIRQQFPINDTSIEKEVLLKKLFKKRLRKSFLYWLMKGNSGD